MAPLIYPPGTVCCELSPLRFVGEIVSSTTRHHGIGQYCQHVVRQLPRSSSNRIGSSPCSCTMLRLTWVATHLASSWWCSLSSRCLSADSHRDPVISVTARSHGCEEIVDWLRSRAAAQGYVSVLHVFLCVAAQQRWMG